MGCGNYCWSRRLFTLIFRFQSIFNSALIIRAYYSIFGDIAQMWIQLSQRSIFPGIQLLRRLSEIGGGRGESQLQREASQISQWSKEATNQIFRLAKEVSMYHRPPLSPHIPLSIFLETIPNPIDKHLSPWKQDKTLQNIRRRVKGIAGILNDLPPSPAFVQSAIKTGVEESKQAAQHGIETQANDSLAAKLCTFLLLPRLILM